MQKILNHEQTISNLADSVDDDYRDEQKKFVLRTNVIGNKYQQVYLPKSKSLPGELSSFGNDVQRLHSILLKTENLIRYSYL